MRITPSRTLLIGTGVVSVFILTLVVAHAWESERQVRYTSQLKPVVDSPQVVSAEVPMTSTLDWTSLQLDVCGDVKKYNKLPWWGKFIEQASRIDYYSDTYINGSLYSATQNEYLNPNHTTYTYDSYCADKNYTDASICVAPKKKLSATDLDEYSEGCLTKDGSGFIAVFPGEYMGGGNYVLRYDIAANIFEVANRLNDPANQDGYTWNTPPTEFGERVGNIIRMTGRGGDAGCFQKTEFNYDIVANTVALTKRCTGCQDEKESCVSYE